MLQQADVPRRYEAPYAVHAPVIDGRLTDAAWRRARWSAWFVDIEGSARPRPRLRTRIKLTWDSTALYVAAQMREPDLWATLTAHDAVIFRDNDFEIFIDPDGDQRNYFEIEINALNAVWDLFLAKPYSLGGHARNEWNAAGLRSAVHLAGTLNDPADRDSGWSVELAIPFADLRQPEVVTPVPRAGDAWRINFSRVEWPLQVEHGRYVKAAEPSDTLPHPESNWVWSPQDTLNMHVPERWGFLTFGR